MFYGIQYQNGWLAASDLFQMFTQSIKFHTFHFHVLESVDVWKIFYGKIRFVLVLTLEIAFSRDLILKPTEGA